MHRLKLLIALLLLLCFPSLARPADATTKPDDDPKRWEKEVLAYESFDRDKPPPPGGALFVGSSSIRLWKLGDSFKDLPVPALNRGIGGSRISDIVHYLPRLVLPYKPKVIVFYCGENDLDYGKSPAQVAEDFGDFLKAVREPLGDVRMIVIGLKPSLKRWEQIDKQRETNALIRRVIGGTGSKHIAFIDVEKPMLGEDGKPKPELYQPDGLHMKPEGYRIWTDHITPVLKAMLSGE